MYYYHPLVMTLVSSILLIANYKNNKIFNIIAIVCPIIIADIIYKTSGTYFFEVYTAKIISNFNVYNKLIGLAFSAVLIAANLYAIGQRKKLEIIFGNIYGGFSLFTLFAGDFISLVIGLELMIVASSSIIFIGGSRNSLRAAKKYFLTHILSSNMIIIGVAYLINKNGNTEIISITDLIQNSNYSQSILVIMLVGFIINIAAFPFSGWMVNYYPEASSSGFIYLIAFTTKVSLFLLLQLFAGYEPLKYFAITMILYASFKALFEDNFLSLLCYLSIISMGFMLIGISYGSQLAPAAISYLFIHIIYKLLLSILVATLIDHDKIILCTKLKRIKNPIILISLLIGIVVMLNIPLTTSFYIKVMFSNFYGEDLLYYYIIILSGIITSASIPWRSYYKAEETAILHLNIYSKISIYFILMILIVIAFAGNFILNFFKMPSIETIPLFSVDLMQQMTIFIAGFAIYILLHPIKKLSNSLNLIESLSAIFFYFYRRWTTYQSVENLREEWSFSSLEKQLIDKLTKLHNQQTAIFTVFFIFLTLLIAMFIYK